MKEFTATARRKYEVALPRFLALNPNAKEVAYFARGLNERQPQEAADLIRNALAGKVAGLNISDFQTLLARMPVVDNELILRQITARAVSTREIGILFDTLEAEWASDPSFALKLFKVLEEEGGHGRAQLSFQQVFKLKKALDPDQFKSAPRLTEYLFERSESKEQLLQARSATGSTVASREQSRPTVMKYEAKFRSLNPSGPELKRYQGGMISKMTECMMKFKRWARN